MQIHPERATALNGHAITAAFGFPTLRGIAQFEILAQVIQIQIQGGPAQLGRPFTSGLVKLNINFAILDRQFTHQQPPQGFVQILNHDAIPSLW